MFLFSVFVSLFQWTHHFKYARYNSYPLLLKSCGNLVINIKNTLEKKKIGEQKCIISTRCPKRETYIYIFFNNWSWISQFSRTSPFVAIFSIFSTQFFYFYFFLNISLNEFCNNGKCDDAWYSNESAIFSLDIGSQYISSAPKWNSKHSKELHFVLAKRILFGPVFELSLSIWTSILSSLWQVIQSLSWQVAFLL